MIINDDDQLDKNCYLFLAVRENRSIDEKIVNVTRWLNEGADVNAVDANRGNNTPAHMAVLRGEIDVLRLLINRGAALYSINSTVKTPLDLARELHTGSKQEIVDLLEAAEKKDKPTTKTQQESLQNAQPKKNIKQPTTQTQYLYSKRTGTSGVCGQLYETKLLSLVLMRALNDKDIKVFYLGTNINGIGDLDDICLRYEVMGYGKPIMVFVQAKHREDRDKGRLTIEDLRSPTGDFSLRKYFDSYLTIKDRFQPDNEDDMFNGHFSSVECNLIIYTPAKDCFTKKRKDNTLSVKVNDLINTGEEAEVFQYQYDDEDVDVLTEMAVEKRVKELAKEFLHLIMAEKVNLQGMMSSKLVARYHAVMGREVIQPLEKQQNNNAYRLWEFRPDFFTSYSKHLETLKKTFYKELSTTRCDKSDIKKEDRNHFQSMLHNTCAPTISKLIGRLVTYDEKNQKLHLFDIKKFKTLYQEDEMNILKDCLSKLEVKDDVIREALRIKLESIQFKLPLAFGNLDMTIRDKRVKHVAGKLHTLFQSHKLHNLFHCYKLVKIVEINDETMANKSVDEGILDINGGIGSAVGNLLVFDHETKMMMFDTENQALPDKATTLLNELRTYMPDNELSSYRLRININGFPKVSFEEDEYEKGQARDFLNILWFYSNQAKEDEVENILKMSISERYNNEKDQNQFTFRIHSDAIFLRSHDEVQKWWMQSGKVPYLSQSSEFFEQAKQAVIHSPLLTVLNFMYNLRIKNIGITFNQDAVKALELDNISQRVFNVVTEANIFSGIKIMQHFEKSDRYTFVDFDYVLSLPLNDYNTMLHELKKTDVQVLIVIYEKLKYYEGLCSKLKQIIELFNGSKIIVVTDTILAGDIKEYYGKKCQKTIDGRTYLVDLTEPSKTKILNEMTILFQGEELPFKSVLYQKAEQLVRTEILLKLIYKEKIEIGHGLLDQIYKDVRDNYIARTLSKDETNPVNTLYDIDDNVVVVSGRSGMGKSVLLTHLSLETKCVDALPWIVRINLRDYEKEFSQWQDQNVTIDASLILHFLCKIAIKNINTEFEIAQHEGHAIVSKVDTEIDPLALFELELFLYLYNSDKVLFLFDDFNAMCPHHEKEVMKIFKMLKNDGKRMWIMTCAYKHTRQALEKEFGTPYKLDRLNPEGKKTFINRFFRTNLRLEQLNYDQFENVRSFLKFMSKFTNKRLVSDPEREIVPLFSLLFHLIYILAVQFFQCEINRASPSIFREKLRDNFKIDLDQYSPVDELLGRKPDDEELELADTPLHLYIASNYFKYRIEESVSFLLDEQEARNKWDLITNTFTLYQHFVEDHVKRIFCKEEADDATIASQYRITRKEFMEKHKKLGLFTICKENDLTKLLKPDEIAEIKDTISRIEKGEDRTTLVNSVVNEVPRFGHLVFAEYFAVEYLVDIMKAIHTDSDMNPLKCPSLWQAVLNIVLFNAPPGVRKAFDYKLQSDSTLAKLAKSDVCREVVFELLLKQRTVPEAQDEGGAASLDTPLTDAIENGFINIVNMFLSSAQGKLNRGNVDEFAGLIRNSEDKLVEFGKEYMETWQNLINSVKNMNVNQLENILKSGELTEVPLRHMINYCRSETANDLQQRVQATTSQIATVTENVQQMLQTQTLEQLLKSMLEMGVNTALNDLKNRLRQE